MSFDDEIDDRRRDVALFRESILDELDGEERARGDLSVRIAELATRSFETPWGKVRSFTERTLWEWWTCYKRQGLLGLVPKARSDKGVAREITPQVLEAAIQARREVPPAPPRPSSTCWCAGNSCRRAHWPAPPSTAISSRRASRVGA